MDIVSRGVSFLARSMGLPPSARLYIRTRQIRTVEQFLRHAGVSPPSSASSLSVDLGSGLEPRNPLGCTLVYGLDIVGNPDSNILGVDLFAAPIPFEDQCVDVITAYDFIEHVPRCAILPAGTRFPFVELMGEVYRVLKPGGLFFSKTPAYPSPNAFVDPTHVNIITEDTFGCYFCGPPFYPQARRYGFMGEFQMVQQRWWGRGSGASLLTLLRKPENR